MSTLSAINLKHPSSGSNNIVLDSSGNMTGAGTLSMSSSFLRNRIINGDMRIDQRNAGAAVTINTAANTYVMDRWRAFGQATDGVFTVQQSTTAPSGFTNSALVTVTTADASIGASQIYVFSQAVEGLNVSDLAWGTASAQTVTLSFQVRSSVTGSFSGSIKNSDGSRSYPFSYTINAANTYETKSVTIAGDTSGTWVTTNGIGLSITFNLGSGSSRLGPAAAWAGANYDGVTGSVALISTLNATWYVTGVQLEVGSVATPFERRLYPQEFAFCQRYFQKSYPIGNAPGNTDGTGLVGGTAMNNGTNSVGNNGMPVAFRTAMRASTTITLYAPYSGTAGSISIAKAATPRADYTATASNASENGFIVASSASGSGGTAGTATELLFQYTASAEL